MNLYNLLQQIIVPVMMKYVRKTRALKSLVSEWVIEVEAGATILFYYYEINNLSIFKTVNCLQ